MECPICQKLKENKNKIYEDELVTAFLKDKSASPGHIILAPKKHAPIIENYDDKIVSHIFVIANKLSSILFETLQIHGTNILVNNGLAAGQDVPHFHLNIIPRMENDSLKLDWTPKQLAEDEMKTAELKLTQFTGNVGNAKQQKTETIEVKEAETIGNGDEDEEENYLIKHLHRIP
ncbi:MAG: HIT family protein [Nanoarchaeota archaeon]|nr:HIT family protein [Nanoarchaeota archaeon]